MTKGDESDCAGPGKNPALEAEVISQRGQRCSLPEELMTAILPASAWSFSSAKAMSNSVGGSVDI